MILLLLNIKVDQAPFCMKRLYRASVQIVDGTKRSLKQSVREMAITIKNMVGLIYDRVANLELFKWCQLH